MKKILYLSVFIFFLISCSEFWDQTEHNTERIIGKWKSESNILVFDKEGDNQTGQMYTITDDFVRSFTWKFDDYDLYIDNAKHDYDNKSSVSMIIDNILYVKL